MTEGQLTRLTRNSSLAVAAVVVLTASLILTACGSGGESASPPDVTVQGAITPISGSSSTSSPTVIGGVIYPDATSTADTTGAAGIIDVSPKEITLGNIVITLSVQGAQPVFDPGRASSSGASGGDNQTPTPQRGFAVLGGSALMVTNNFDGAQNPPADTPQQMLRHVAIQIRDKVSGQLIPYAVVSMDLLREGRPTLQDQALIAMLQAGADVSQMQYGNNVKFPGKGDYQIFIRLQPNPLIGSSSTGVAMFNVSIK